MFHASQTPPVIEREHLIDPDQGLFVVDDPVYPREHSTILAKRAALQIQNSDLHNLPPRLDVMRLHDAPDRDVRTHQVLFHALWHLPDRG